jgi:hypothetical protein
MAISLQADSSQPQGYFIIDGQTAMTISMSGISTSAPVNAWDVISTGKLLTKASRTLTDTRTGSFTCTLPATPSLGDWVEIGDAFGTWGTNSLTLNRNGQLVASDADNLICNVNFQFLTLIFVGSTVGWQVYGGGS